MLLIPTTARSVPASRYWLVLAAVLVTIKLVLALFDPTMRFFLGDSESYLHTALTGWIPPDRSFLYGKFVAASALLPGSLYGLLIAQSLCGVFSALLLARIACIDLGADRRLAAVLACALALDPAQLFYERMMMAESLGCLCLLGMLACGFAYLRKQWWPWLLAVALFGIATVALRMSLLPMVLGFALLPALVPLAHKRGRLNWLRVAGHATIALAATALLHNAYQYWYGRLSEGPRTYLQSSGTFRLGLVAPLLRPEHLQEVGLPADLLTQVGPDLRAPRQREAQLWLDDGLIAVLRRAAGADTENKARRLASLALRDDIPGFLRLAAATTADYFVAQETRTRMADDLGTRPLSADAVEKLRDRLGYDASRFHEVRNPVALYFERMGNWLIVCLFALAPLGLIVLLRQWQQRRNAALLLCLSALGLVAGQLLFSHIVSFRYLHAFPPLVLLCLAGCFASARRTSGLEPSP
ncbi:hypothetical protein DFR29_11416 [Tahibacter aquaticus]|uniref:Dolichyl-phosphate-mannose-protein mannosyltransferase n=1 Tax=Tahibacter aquaticus TaxID=520092 RepID=A0A4R6YQ17_9GAMM|nr:hypothetical protein [Tahibacter aquaticus]TDR39965.1 hypothetical protein DFR29_11416 [Tahibacter aquaticus]